MTELISRRDLSFLLYEWLDIESLTERKRFSEHSRETFDAVLDLTTKIATEHFETHARESDENEPTFDGKTVTTIPQIKEALDVYGRSGLIASTMDAEYGGMQLPQTVHLAHQGILQAANVGTTSYPFLTIGNAELILAHGTQEQRDTWIPPMMEGRFFGTMALSEPQAGSSLSDITTKAVPQDDGTYRLFGNKMWISAAEHEISDNIVHLVLAKIPGGPPGVKGISLFIVPKFLLDDSGAPGERNDVALAGLNHKLGQRGTTNTLLNFGEGTFPVGGEAGAVGYLVGEEHKGLSYMFHMMNAARVGVGLCATALGYVGYLRALDYAKVRPQGRPPQGKDATAPQVPIIEHADVRRMLLAQKAYAEGALALELYCGKLLDLQSTAIDDAEAKRLGLLLDVLTPIAKSWPSQWCVEANSLAIQVHGGYGYTRDYDVERYWRDNRLNMIHEGTHGIQANDLLGRKVVMQGGAGLGEFTTAVRDTIEKAGALDGQPADAAAQLSASLDRLLATTERVWAAGDTNVTLANANAYLEAFGHVTIAWMWLEQLLAAHGKDGAFYDGKRAAAQFFYRYELPKVATWLDLLDSLDRLLLDLDPASL